MLGVKVHVLHIHVGGEGPGATHICIYIYELGVKAAGCYVVRKGPDGIKTSWMGR